MVCRASQGRKGSQLTLAMQDMCAVLGSEELLAYPDTSVREGLLLSVEAVVHHFSDHIPDPSNVALLYLVRALVQVTLANVSFGCTISTWPSVENGGMQLHGQMSAEDVVVPASAQSTLRHLAQKYGFSSVQELILPLFPQLLGSITVSCSPEHVDVCLLLQWTLIACTPCCHACAAYSMASMKPCSGNWTITEDGHSTAWFAFAQAVRRPRLMRASGYSRSTRMRSDRLSCD